MVPCLGYLACTAPLKRAVGAVQGCTDQVHNSVDTVVQRSWVEEFYHSANRAQAALPRGGLIISQLSSEHSAAARLVSNALTEVAMTEAPEYLQPLSSPLHHGLAAAWSDVWQVVQTVNLETHAQINEAHGQGFLACVQHMLSVAVAHATHKAMLATQDDSIAACQISHTLHSISSPAAATVLEALPSTPTLTMAKAVLEGVLRHGLGIPSPPTRAPGVISACHTPLSSIVPNHALVCTAPHPQHVMRLNAVIKAVRHDLQRGGVASTKKPRLSAAACTPNHCDGVAPGTCTPGSPTAVNCDPCCPSYLCCLPSPAHTFDPFAAWAAKRQSVETLPSLVPSLCLRF
jgi:hypothetical protein